MRFTTTNGLLVPRAKPLPEITWALKLQSFIGRDKVTRFGRQHPLAGGFHLMRKSIVKASLHSTEWPVVADLNLSARTILTELETEECGDVLRGHLSDTEHCRSLLFEAHVAEFVLRPSVSKVGWRRYVPGRSDFLTVAPQLQVECKLVTRKATAKRVIEKAFERADQWRADEGPFVLVAGCVEPIDREQIAALPAVIRETAQTWFARHTQVAAVIAILPEQLEGIRWNATSDYQSVQFRNGSAVILRSNVATNPLPPTFDFKIRDH